jgi:hypothetical protein
MLLYYIMRLEGVTSERTYMSEQSGAKQWGKYHIDAQAKGVLTHTVLTQTATRVHT